MKKGTSFNQSLSEDSLSFGLTLNNKSYRFLKFVEPRYNYFLNFHRKLSVSSRCIHVNVPLTVLFGFRYCGSKLSNLIFCPGLITGVDRPRWMILSTTKKQLAFSTISFPSTLASYKPILSCSITARPPAIWESTAFDGALHCMKNIKPESMKKYAFFIRY